MISMYYGRLFSNEYLASISYISHDGVSLQSLKEAAETIGFSSVPVILDLESISNQLLPCILHWNQDHFVVLYKIRRSRFSIKSKKDVYFIADPADGIIRIDKDTLKKNWATGPNIDKGTALLLYPINKVFEKVVNKPATIDIKNTIKYLYPHKRNLLHVSLILFIGSLISLAFPLLMQTLIDQGVGGNNFSIVKLVLLSQTLLYLGDAILENIRSWLLMHIGTRISFAIISEFLNKLFRLPIKFYESKKIGDFSQRIDDHSRIERFLTGSIINTIFSILSILIYIIIITYYSYKVLLVYLILNTFGIIWIFLFKNRRRRLDTLFFSNKRRTIDVFYELIRGMQEIKLYSSEKSSMSKWEELQYENFNLTEKSVRLQQFQHTGFSFFLNLRNIIISFVCAGEVINGHMTLGILLGISYIVGQTNGPLLQLVDFIKSAQDALLSMERLKSILEREEEKNNNLSNVTFSNENILVKSLSFQFEGKQSPYILQNINIVIPKNKITAIVGVSGSGKTTFLKMLLNYYTPTIGEIQIGGTSLNEVPPDLWRNQCGTVMQDGYIFTDTIANNISMSDEIDYDKLNKAIVVANLENLIENLPLGIETKIGNGGAGLSGGQKQRILIARAVYKNPRYIFFDEATSNLDSSTEKQIMKNLKKFFSKKTVVVIAHRMSTVKNADQIIVFDNGKVFEIGTHATLINKKGKYYDLVKNQLEF